MAHAQKIEKVLSLGGMVTMETMLKQHNQIELPQEVCRKLDLSPGARFDVEVNSNTGMITLVPIIRKSIRVNHGRQKIRSRVSTDPHK